jgi:FixJ family two-component response regulator
MSRSGQTIFIIDDDQSVLRAVGRLIRAAGMDTVTFVTAEEFLALPQRPAAGCLILDVHLPGLSGLELQQRLSAEGRSIPIVFITAFEDEQARGQALGAGAVAFLQKPFGEVSLLEAVERALAASPDEECPPGP